MVEAPGKVNLFLRVGPCRPDGYHEVLTVMQAVSLRDELVMGLQDGDDDYQVDLMGQPWSLPWTPDNLARRAWEAFRRELGGELRGKGLYLRLRKRIPVAGGMGGGSADAAAVLLGLNQLCGRPFEWEHLQLLAGELGSDVPFFLEGGTALAEGRGEVVTPLDEASHMYVVLALPQERLSTADVYARFDRRGDGSSGDLDDGRLDRLLKAIEERDIDEMVSSMHNDLQDSCLELSKDAMRRYWVFRRTVRSMDLEGPRSPVMVSGSGPTLFMAVEELEVARRLARRLIEEIRPVMIVSFEDHGCLVRPLR